MIYGLHQSYYCNEGEIRHRTLQTATTHYIYTSRRHLVSTDWARRLALFRRRVLYTRESDVLLKYSESDRLRLHSI